MSAFKDLKVGQMWRYYYNGANIMLMTEAVVIEHGWACVTMVVLYDAREEPLARHQVGKRFNWREGQYYSTNGWLELIE